MSTEERNPDLVLDQILSEIRDEPIDPAVLESAAARVRTGLGQAAGVSLRVCADYRNLIPAWLDGSLPEARRLLVEDHTRECPACRKAFQAARAPKPVAIAAPKRSAFRERWAAWAMAAALLLAAGLGGLWLWNRYGGVPEGTRATLQTVDGTLVRAAADAPPVAPGAAFGERETFRTAKGSTAVVRLRDGSLVELAERTELSVSERREGATINLAGGRIIVQAAKQRSRHLYVATEDCTVSVTGTVFSVNHGVKGSRVAVIEGEVRVTQGNQTKVLRPGEQTSTSADLEPVAVRDEFAWSRNADTYFALLKEFSVLRGKLEAIPAPGLRYSSRLLDFVPEGTVFYAAVPNFGPNLAEGHRLFREQIQQSAVLRQWWKAQTKPGGGEPPLEEMIARLRSFSDYLGREIVLASAPNAKGEHQTPLVMAEVARGGFRAFLETEMAKTKGGAPVAIVEDAAQLPLSAGNGKRLFVLLRSGVVAASIDPAQLRKAAALIDRPGSGAFSKSPFRARIEEAYRAGAGWLFSADLQPMLAARRADETLRRAGVEGPRYLVVERKEVAGKTTNSAALTFAGARNGIASWLASPAPNRALDFVSPEASFAVGAVAKAPAQMLDDLMAMFSASNRDLPSRLHGFETLTGVGLRTDLAARLGGEMAFAVDGPLLPKPSWKLVLEVSDPAGLQAAIEKLTAVAGGQLRMEKLLVGGQTFYSLRGPQAGQEAHYVFSNGFLVAAPDRTLLTRALEVRQSGDSLPRSAKFIALLPRDSHVNFSGVLYYNAGAAGEVLSGLLPGGEKLSPEQRRAAATFAATPAAVVAYGEGDRIRVAAAGSGLFGWQPEHLLLAPKFRHPK